MGSAIACICNSEEEDKNKKLQESILRSEVRAEVVSRTKHLKREESAYLPEKSAISGNVIKTHYDLLEDIGKGSFGQVQKAYLKIDSSRRRPFAVKTVEKSANQKELKRFLREIEILKNLDHPFIIRFFEACESKNSYFIIQEMCEGGDLGKMLELQNHGLREADARWFMWQILQAINYLHFKGIAHRDIKPENFLLVNKTSSNIKLIDFGLSATIKCSEDVIKETVGSPFYIAPEVLDKNYTPLCDIWSAGIILYNFMTCLYPFEHEENPVLFELIKKGVYNLQPVQDCGYSSEAKDLLSKMLVREESDDGTKRISALEALKHDWFAPLREEVRKKGEALLNVEMLQNMRNFGYNTLIQREMVSLMVQESDFSEPEIQKICDIFAFIDTDFSGTLCTKEIEAIYSKFGIALREGEIEDIIDSMYFKEKAVVTYLQFIAACLNKEFYQNKKRVRELFDYIDVDLSGEIEYKDIKDCFIRFGRLLDENKIRRMIEECDLNNDQKISFEEFYRIIVAEKRKK